MTRIGLACISDRADLYLPGCMESLDAHLADDPFVARTVIDDRDHQLGMAGAVRAAWRWAVAQNLDYLFHVEEDFVFEATIPIAEMVAILEQAPYLAQVVLVRQPWNETEAAAGGIIASDPGAYIQLIGEFGRVCWVEHRKIFSLNPCLIPRPVLEADWDDDNEAGFTQRCLDAGRRFAYFGHRDDTPRVTHVGSVRGAGWRL